jgi:hypothetical protein
VTAERETCGLLQKGVAAIFGPQNMASAEHIRSITDVAEVPFIDTKWNMHPVNPILTSMTKSQYVINLHPDVTTLGKCCGYISTFIKLYLSQNIFKNNFDLFGTYCCWIFCSINMIVDQMIFHRRFEPTSIITKVTNDIFWPIH